MMELQQASDIMFNGVWIFMYVHTWNKQFHTAGGEDYATVSADLVFSGTAQSHEVVIPITADESLELKTESFTVQLTRDREDDSVLLIPSQSTITIVDNDSTLNSS